MLYKKNDENDNDNNKNNNNSKNHFFLTVAIQTIKMIIRILTS